MVSAVVAQALNHGTSEAEAGGSWFKIQFKASLVYNRVSSRTVRATKRNPVLKSQNKKMLSAY